ncbi:hypothetical protein KUA24_144 [Vibrio phage HNL01]|nr:hypothetical protein KUA24_144 [Vibrio phage HNL01]
MTITVFNEKSTAHITGDYPIFLGEEPALYDSINQPYPKFYDMMENLKQIDWAPDDVDLTDTRMDLLRCDENTRNLMLFNLAYQWSIDSIATAIPTLLAPFITNSEYGHLVARIGENEMLHALSYSNIVRQCVPDPQEVFDMIFKHEEVLERSEVIGSTLADLKRVGAEYTLGLKTDEECKPFIVKGLVAIYSLERISFMSSFACTFALAEQEYFVGAARLVQKILQDEMIHFEGQRYTLEVLQGQEGWSHIFEEYKQDIQNIIEGVVDQETAWNKYIFSGGRSLVGLNTGILNDWTRYCAQEVCDNLNITPSFRITKTCPLPWFEQDWMDLNNQQAAAMETDITNYMVSAVSRDVSGNGLKSLGLSFEDEDTLEPECENTFVVYSKPNCPFCIKVKGFMEERGLQYEEVRVDLLPEERELLLSKGLKTVPQIFDQDGNYHGDCTTFIAKNS